MVIIEQLSDLGYSQVDLDALEACLAFSGKQDIYAVAMLTDGRLLATADSWRDQFGELQSICFDYLRSDMQATWLQATPHIIRELLTDADGIRRARQTRGIEQDANANLALHTLRDMVTDALNKQATDIHIRLAGFMARISYRIDGLLVLQGNRNRVFVTEVVAAALHTHSEDHADIFDERQVSAATITIDIGTPAQTIRIRAQKSPCRDGFTMTLRLQRIGQGQVPQLSELGLAAERILDLNVLLASSNGVILISGPTGHGKTTTLAALNGAVPDTRKVISLEDPIEIIQPRVDQKYISHHHGQHFADMLKVVLREDPDIVEVSEIRDRETAEAALSAALTGHLVASTIHATDAVGVIARLHDLGLSALQLAQPGLFAGLIAQRLLPRLCEDCKHREVHPVWGRLWRRSQEGCEACQGTGIQGRVMVCEVLIPKDESYGFIRHMDLQGWRQQLQNQGWITMAHDAVRFIRRGQVDWQDAGELVPGLTNAMIRKDARNELGACKITTTA
ncbi:GspE/PulE family protein [Aliidiomarina indica]|uniref:GspE/PulE family protein n=1 Tax=Aliidiomarina indica TaxID=2749147 RepID=UPI0018905EE7|nr:ATPase, T2SS/T4P/T4SS family [Aliidiomarina indica]